MRLRELVDDLDLPPTRVAEGAWEAAAQRARRRRTVAVAGAAAAVAVVLATAVLISARDNGRPPANEPTTPTPSHSGPRIATPEMATTPGPYDAETFKRLLGEPLRPPANAPGLSTSPIPYAKLAMTPAVDSTEVFVLGPDEDWRRLDLPLQKVRDGSGYENSPFRSTSLSPDATMLALPQPSSVIVVDLTDGSHQQYSVPNPYLVYANWLSDSRVVVGTEGQGRWEMDLDDGDVTESRFGPSTGRAPDGGLVTWGMGDDGFPTPIEWNDGASVSSEYNNTAGLQSYPPLVDEAVVVGNHATNHTGIGLRLGQNAMMVVDRETGSPMAYLPTVWGKGDYTTLLGWDEDRIVVALLGEKITDTEYTVVLTARDWKEKTLEPLVTIAGWHVAWGRGW